MVPASNYAQANLQGVFLRAACNGLFSTCKSCVAVSELSMAMCKGLYEFVYNCMSYMGQGMFIIKISSLAVLSVSCQALCVLS